MSLAIRPDKVTAVLLADGWMPVVEGSLEFGAFEFQDAGADSSHGPGGLGFSFESSRGGERVTGPISSLLAVQTTID